MSGDWLVVSTLPPPHGQELMLVDALRRAGARAVEREGERYLALFAAPERVEPLIAELRNAIRASTTLADPDLSWRWRSHAEWADRWRTEQAARRVTDRVVVAPAGVDVGALGPDDVVVRLDPGVAFGTAEHATTRGCLTLVDGRVRRGGRVLDVGAGSGILAIAAVLLGADRALALEADPLVCSAARRNAELNGVADRVEVRELEVGPAELRRAGRFDGVVVNIETRVTLPLIPALPAVLRPDGWVVVSGIVGEERDVVVTAAEQAGFALVEERPERSWWTGAFTRG